MSDKTYVVLDNTTRIIPDSVDNLVELTLSNGYTEVKRKYDKGRAAAIRIKPGVDSLGGSVTLIGLGQETDIRFRVTPIVLANADPSIKLNQKKGGVEALLRGEHDFYGVYYNYGFMIINFEPGIIKDIAGISLAYP